MFLFVLHVCLFGNLKKNVFNLSVVYFEVRVMVIFLRHNAVRRTFVFSIYLSRNFFQRVNFKIAFTITFKALPFVFDIFTGI